MNALGGLPMRRSEPRVLPRARGAAASLAGALLLAAAADAQDGAWPGPARRNPAPAECEAASIVEDDPFLDSWLVRAAPDLSVLDELLPSTIGGELRGPLRAARQEPQQPEEKKRWSSFLPLLKEEALARGYVLPLPFGPGSTILAGRDIEVTDLRVGVNGAPLASVQKVDLGSESDVFNANLKLDAWILPFLNVYTLLGYIYNESSTNVHVSLPGPPPIEFDLNVDSKLDGFVGGGGLTLAAGYDAFFLVVDSNYTQTDIGFDDSFRAVTASMRAGFQAEVGGKPLQTWLGGSYWDTENVAKGHADVPGVGRIDFEADQGPVYPWVIDFGANARIAPWFEFFFDVATDLHGGIIATVGPVFRF